MKSFLVIGAGTFGHHICRELVRQKCEVMIVDSDAKPLEDLVNVVTSAKIADCANIETLRSFDIPSFDACFVSVGRNFQYSLEITSLLKELGAKKVFAKADEDIQAKFLLGSPSFPSRRGCAGRTAPSASPSPRALTTFSTACPLLTTSASMRSPCRKNGWGRPW